MWITRKFTCIYSETSESFQDETTGYNRNVIKIVAGLTAFHDQSGDITESVVTFKLDLFNDTTCNIEFRFSRNWVVCARENFIFLR